MFLLQKYKLLYIFALLNFTFAKLRKNTTC